MHSPKHTCYCINRNDNATITYHNDNATITYHSIQKQRRTAKELSMGSFQVLVYMQKSVFTPHVCLYQEQTSVRMNVFGAYTHILLPGMLGNSKQVTCWPMALKLCASPYISTQMRVFLFPLRRFMI